MSKNFRQYSSPSAKKRNHLTANEDSSSPQPSLHTYFYKKPKKKEYLNDSISSSSTSSSSKTPLSSQPKQPSLTQSVLNFGQKGQNPILCKECGMQYLPTSEEDRKLHDKYHRTYTHLPYQPSKNDKILYETDSYKILCIDRTLPLSFQKKAQHICAFLHTQMNALEEPWNEQFYSLIFYVSRNYITGILLVRLEVHRVFLCSKHSEYDPTNGLLLSSPILGIDRIWVAQPRQGIGTLLVRWAQKEYQCESLAFSQPTEMGWKFALALVGAPPIYIYL